MRNKIAKALRREAEFRTIGKELTFYEIGSPPLFEKVRDANGFPTGRVIKIKRGVPTTLINCTRKKYKDLKAQYKCLIL